MIVISAITGINNFSDKPISRLGASHFINLLATLSLKGPSASIEGFLFLCGYTIRSAKLYGFILYYLHCFIDRRTLTRFRDFGVKGY